MLSHSPHLVWRSGSNKLIGHVGLNLTLAHLICLWRVNHNVNRIQRTQMFIIIRWKCRVPDFYPKRLPDINCILVPCISSLVQIFCIWRHQTDTALVKHLLFFHSGCCVGSWVHVHLGLSSLWHLWRLWQTLSHSWYCHCSRPSQTLPSRR